MMAQGLYVLLVNLLDDIVCYRFKLYQERPDFIKLCAGRQLLQVAREIAGGRRKLREHATALVSRFAQSRRVPVTQRVPERGKLLWDARGERLTHLPEQGRVAPAGGQQHRCVEQVPPPGLPG